MAVVPKRCAICSESFTLKDPSEPELGRKVYEGQEMKRLQVVLQKWTSEVFWKVG